MKTLILSLFLLSMGTIVTSCQPEEIQPNQPISTEPTSEDTTGTGGNDVDSTLIKFTVRTVVPTQYLDSVFVVQAISGNPIDTLVILPTDIVGLDLSVDGKVRFNANQINAINTMQNVAGQQFIIRIYFDAPTGYNDTSNVFEFGYNDNTNTPSNMFSLTQIGSNGNKYLHGFQ